MTDRQRAALLRSALADFRKTKEGYVTHPDGPNWRAGMEKANRLLKDLTPLPAPKLGPLVENGLSLLLMVPTHNSDGLKKRTGSEYPAVDTEFGQVGRWVVAPEALTVTKQSSSQGGDAFYATGASGLKYWFGHIGPSSPATGTKFRKGQRISRVASMARPHLHVGIDARPLIGQDLLYGGQRKRTDRPVDYTFGSPTIGAQLAAMLAAV